MRPRILVLVVILSTLAVCASQPGGAGPRATSPGDLARLSPVPSPNPSDGTWYADPEGRFRILVPINWTVRTGPGTQLGLWPPTGNSNVGLVSETWCTRGSDEEALAILWDALQDHKTDSGFRLEQPPFARTVNGKFAAETWFTHFLANGKAYQKLVVILGPEWSSAWIYSGLVHDASEMSVWPTINATLETVTILGGPAPSQTARASTHFQVGIPNAWHAQTNVTIGGDLADVVMSDALGTVVIVIVSEPRNLAGTSAEARAILQETINPISTQPGFQLIEPVTDQSVDGHPAARAFVTWQPSTFNVDSSLAVVVGAEWRRAWALAGPAQSWYSAGARTCFNETLMSFHIEAGPPGVFPTTYYGWLFAGAAAATAAEGAVLGFLILRDYRRKS